MFVTQARFEAMARNRDEWIREYNRLLKRWNALVERVNARGGEDFLTGRASTFTPDEIDRLIRLCHPDKHGNSETATRMTQRLLGLRK